MPTIYRIRLPRTPHPKNKDEFLLRVIEFGILGLLLFSPLPAASVFPWAITLIAVVSILLTICYVLIENKPEVNPLLVRRLKWPRYLFGGFLLYVAFQVIPLPVGLVKLLSPHAVVLREAFSFQVGEWGAVTLSLAPFHTIREGLEMLSYILIGFLVIQTVTTSEKIKRIIYLCIGMGVFQALYGIFELFRGDPHILFMQKTINLEKATGTFINQNHFAGFLEMIIPLALALILARIDLFSLSGMDLKEKFLRITAKGFTSNVMALICVFVMCLGLLFSRSRAALFSVFLTFFLFFVMSLLYFGQLRRARPVVRTFLNVSFLAVLVIFLYMGIGSNLKRFEEEERFGGDRPQYWHNTVEMIGDFPLMGTGLGTFAFVYPAYEEENIYALLIHAHNDWLEYFSELGLVGMVFLLGGVLFLFVRSFSLWRIRRNAEIKGLGLGGLVALIVMGVHSITDFNLHIPANMLLFTIILCLTTVVVHYGKRDLTPTSRTMEDDTLLKKPETTDWESEYQVAGEEE
ncbi:MAG: O-antigen ligase family protein [Acidobacteriota bacterium]